MDIKFIGSGPSTKAIIYYITDYITKSQLQSHVAYAALELAVCKLNQINTEDDLPTIRAKKLLQKCAYAMVSHQELSAQQVATYLMEFEDHFTSHEYKNIYWTGFDAYVAGCLSLNQGDENTNISHEETTMKESDTENSEIAQREDEIGITSNHAGEIVPKSGQILDYIKRGNDLKNTCLWEYISRACKITIKLAAHGKMTTQMEKMNDLDSTSTYQDKLDSTSGRPKFAFSEDHPDYETHIQQLCPPDKALVPVAIGIAFPRHDQEQELSHYHRVMLTLFKPWFYPLDLIDNVTSSNIADALANSFSAMLAEHPKVGQKLDNMQSLHKCKDSRDDHFQERQNERKRASQHQTNNQQTTGNSNADDFFFGDPNDIGDEILEQNHFQIFQARCQCQVELKR